MNELFSDSYAPRYPVKLTRPITPWMKHPSIVSDRQKLELSRIKSRDSKNRKEHQKHLEYKKQCKKTVKDKKNSVFRKELSSKIPKTVWNSINCTLNKQQKRINHESSEMNN